MTVYDAMLAFVGAHITMLAGLYARRVIATLTRV